VGRIGILGGAFNPPHLGHLALACHARDELQLGRVLLMPTHTSPHKPIEEDPGAGHRLSMCRRLVEHAEALSSCALEVERGGASFTVDTLAAIHTAHPEAQLTLILGADTARTLPSWRKAARVLELADLAVGARSGSTREQVLESIAELRAPSGALGSAVSFLDMPVVEISSSMARGRVARGEPIEDLVGPAVARYVADHRLYEGRPLAHRDGGRRDRAGAGS
jgi:nicotinate-nucleotide adenylyltransferase